MPDTLQYAHGEDVSDTLSTSIGSSDTSLPVSTISKWDISGSGGVVAIDLGTSTQEFIITTGHSGSSLTVASSGRGAYGTTAQGHNAGATIQSVPFAHDWNNVISSLTNVVKKTDGTLDTTKVVNLTTAQTLTNKTIDTAGPNTLKVGGQDLTGAWTTWTPSYSAGGSMTYTSVTTLYARYIQIGKMVWFQASFYGTTGGSADSRIRFTVPVNMKNYGSSSFDGGGWGGIEFNSSGGGYVGPLVCHAVNNTTIECLQYNGSNFSLVSGIGGSVSGCYEAA